MEPRLVVYLDVELIVRAADFVFDYLLLWAAAEVAAQPVSKRRLAAGALVGTLYGLLYHLAGWRLIPAYGLVRSWPAVLAASLSMLAVTFAPIRWQRLFSLAATFYGILFCAAGAGLAAAFLFGTPDEPNGLVGRIVALAGIAVTAELGFGVLQKRLWQGIYQMPLEVVFGDRAVRMMSLVDTGNRLRDPLSRLPVVVMEHQALQRILPPEIEPALASMEEGDLSAVSRLLTSREWSKRFRVIPFNSVGQTNGLLIGFRPDALFLFFDGRRVPTQEAIIGVTRRPLDAAGAYQALLHPEVVQAAAAIQGAMPHAPAPVPTGGESVHAAARSKV